MTFSRSPLPAARVRRVFATGLAAGLVLMAGCRHDDRDAAAPSPKIEGDTVVYPADAPQRTALVTAPVQAQAGSTLRFTGRVVWNEDTTVRIYSPVLGRVRSVDAKLGDRVEAGAPLARLDSPDLGQALADARKADADLTLAERTLSRMRDLFNHGAVAQKDVESAEDAQASAAAEQQRARAKLALYGGAADGTDQTYALRAPIAGTVVEKNLNPGQEVRPDLILAGVPQFTVAPFVVTNPHELWVLLDTTELDITALQPNQTLRITSRAYPGRTFAGRIDVVGASLDAATRTLKVRGLVENPDLLLKAEMYVDVEADRQEPAGVVAVAAQAVFRADDRSYVYVEVAPGRYTRRAVRTGAESDGRIIVHEGLKADDHVVVEGALLLEAVRTGGGAA